MSLAASLASHVSEYMALASAWPACDEMGQATLTPSSRCSGTPDDGLVVAGDVMGQAPTFHLPKCPKCSQRIKLQPTVSQPFLRNSMHPPATAAVYLQSTPSARDCPSICAAASASCMEMKVSDGRSESKLARNAFNVPKERAVNRWKRFRKQAKERGTETVLAFVPARRRTAQARRRRDGCVA